MYVIVLNDENASLVQIPFAKEEDAEKYAKEHNLSGNCRIYEVDWDEDDTDPDA